jgi:transglutaminase-like putative cysteine protease
VKRREFLHTSAAFYIGASALSAPALAIVDPFRPRPGAWRAYELTTAVTLAPGKAANAWLPVPSFQEQSWMRPQQSRWDGNAASVALVRDPRWSCAMVYAQWPAASAPRRLTVKSTVAVRDLFVDLRMHSAPAPLSETERALYLAPTKYIPTDGLVKTTADKVTAGATTDLEKAQRIYAWIIANTYRKPTVRGCGLGDITFLLESGDLGGKCADLNGLAVGLARASGIPARDLYGIRVAPSRFGYKSLGANSSTVSKSQHCRAEVYLVDYGWVPMDPADVRKVIVEEPPGDLRANDPKVVEARETLFGAWEGNYVAYNDAHDLTLPGSKGDPVAFLMYPQAEIDGERLDSLDPATFTYEITAKQL